MNDLKFGDIIVYTCKRVMAEYHDVNGSGYQELYIVIDSATVMDSLGQQESSGWLYNAPDDDYTVVSKGDDTWKKYFTIFYKELKDWKAQTVDAILEAEKYLEQLNEV